MPDEAHRPHLQPIPGEIAYLEVASSFDSSHVGQRFELTGDRVRFGRAPHANDICLFRDDTMSRWVGWFERREGGWWVVDNGSTCGVFVNEQSVPKPPAEDKGERRLDDNDLVSVGRVALRFRLGDADAPPT